MVAMVFQAPTATLDFQVPEGYKDSLGSRDHLDGLDLKV